MMDDDTMLRTLLRRTASGDPLEATDPEPLVRRGDRVVRRRRVAGVTTAVAAVAAVTWGANSLTGIDSSDGTPPVATVQTTASAAPAVKLFEPVPGVQPGEAALADMTKAEASRRCKLRYPDERRWLADNYWGYPGGGRASYDGPPLHDRLNCLIPGDSRPTADAIAQMRWEPLPASHAGKLRNCSIRLWHNITGWRIMLSESEPGQLTNLVAVSPSGRYAARCSLSSNPNADGLAGSWIRTMADTKDNLGYPTRDDLKHFPVAGSQTCAGPKCVGWLHDEIGRVASTIARIRVEKPNGRVHDIKVVEGWYVFAWGDRDPKGGPDAKVTTYDAAGNVIKRFN